MLDLTSLAITDTAIVGRSGTRIIAFAGAAIAGTFDMSPLPVEQRVFAAGERSAKQFDHA